MSERRTHLSPKPDGKGLWTEKDFAMEEFDRMMGGNPMDTMPELMRKKRERVHDGTTDTTEDRSVPSAVFNSHPDLGHDNARLRPGP